MTVKLIRAEIRPSLEHLFYCECRRMRFLIDKSTEMDKNKKYTVEPGELSYDWLEKISLDEIHRRQAELRPDLRFLLFGKTEQYNKNIEQLPTYNPFALTNTIIKIFENEDYSRNSYWLKLTLPRDSENLKLIRAIENTILYQIFVDEELIETIEIK